MSERFPAVTYRDILKVAKKLGWYFCRQAKGDHEIWRCDENNRYTTIPNHGKKILKRKTTKAILDDLQISAKEFIKLKKGK